MLSLSSNYLRRLDSSSTIDRMQRQMKLSATAKCVVAIAIAAKELKAAVGDVKDLVKMAGGKKANYL